MRRPVCWGRRVRQRLDCEESSLEGGEHRDDIYRPLWTVNLQDKNVTGNVYSTLK